MNTIAKFRPNYIDYGPLPLPEDFSSLEELKNSLTDHVVLAPTDTLVVLEEPIVIGECTFYWLMVRKENSSLYKIAKLKSLEYIPAYMLISLEKYTLLCQAMHERIKILQDTAREERKLRRQCQESIS